MPGSENKKCGSPPKAAGGLGRLPRSTVARGARVGVGVAGGVGVMLGVGVTDGVAVSVGVGESVAVAVSLGVAVAVGSVDVGTAAVCVNRSATCEATGCTVAVAGA